MKWRDVEIGQLDDRSLVEALRQCLAIGYALWSEVARRRLVGKV